MFITHMSWSCLEYIQFPIIFLSIDFQHEFQQIGRQKREETISSDSDEASPVATWMHSLVCVCCTHVHLRCEQFHSNFGVG